MLVVEDEELLADAVARGLRRAAAAVDVCGDGAVALDRLAVHRYDVVVLDRDLPGVHGDEVCRAIIAAGDGPRVLMLTAAAAVDDRVDGLRLGADDYLTKPFAFAELVARVEALARRPARSTVPVLRHGDIEIDRARLHATRGERQLALSLKEFAVLEVLLTSEGAVVSAEELLERVWDEHIDPFTNTVRVTMANLRRKLGEPPVIATVIGAGYRIA